MNHIYKVIWNTITQTWVAVSELSRAKGKTKSSKTLSAVVLAAVSAGGIVGDAEAANAVGTGNDSSLVFGKDSKAFYELENRKYFANNAVALGTSAHARASEDVAIGNEAISGAPVKFKTDEYGNFILERGQKIPVYHTSEDASVAVGTNAKAEVVATTAIGAHANALGIYSTAVGAGAKAEKANSSAFGQGAMATADYSTAIGKSAHAKEQYSIALGKESQAETGYSTSVGFKTEAKGLSSLALGSGMVPLNDITGDGKVNEDDVAKQRTIADGDGAFAAGASANATGSYASALSAESTAKGDYAFAAGAASKATANNATALGKQANATGDSAVAVGAKAQASNNYDAAFGSNATASGSYSSAFGNNSQATNADASAFGNEAKALATNATSVGPHSKVDTGATYGSALGRNASVTAANGTALGSLSSVTAANGTAVGTSATVSTAGGVALGQGSKSTRAALDGGSITISSVGNVILSNHITDKDITDKDNSTVHDVYAPVKLINDKSILERVKNTIKGTAGAVSLGNNTTTRQLTNLAPGSADYDAVNVAQLKAVVGTIKHYNVTSKDGDITINPDTTDPNKTVWDLKINPKYKIKYFRSIQLATPMKIIKVQLGIMLLRLVKMPLLPALMP
ncbi:ESPR-type extended signal peptide-containing protein [Haemophilus seminalis]|uniref:ESPR-type extended signal peptide-containing protein n=1 Tax=Haemophilus seminalis TaxID=2582921 RepID=UPI002554A785|nr:ESPR-type extended signal peptide-containing protein [Haemophilus seminalis]MDK7281036.1 ESPR-type extended signal peptide-containing protein [Haemophilus seminalis]